MAAFHFSRRAEADLLEIGAYTLENWGADQTIRYIVARASGHQRSESGNDRDFA